MKKKLADEIFPLYVAGGDTYYSVLEELNSFICTRMEDYVRKDYEILGKISYYKYVESIGMGSGKKDNDDSIKELIWRVIRRFSVVTDELEPMYSVIRRCWLIVKKEKS